MNKFGIKVINDDKYSYYVNSIDHTKYTNAYNITFIDKARIVNILDNRLMVFGIVLKQTRK